MLLAVHAGIATWAATQALVTPPEFYRPDGFLNVTLVALGAFAVAFAWRGVSDSFRSPAAASFAVTSISVSHSTLASPPLGTMR